MKKRVLCSMLASALLTGCSLNAGSLQDTPPQSEKIQPVSNVQDHDASAVQEETQFEKSNASEEINTESALDVVETAGSDIETEARKEEQIAQPEAGEQVQSMTEAQSAARAQAAAEAQAQAAVEAQIQEAIQAQAAAIEEESETEEHTAVGRAVSAVQAVAEAWAEEQEAAKQEAAKQEAIALALEELREKSSVMCIFEDGTCAMDCWVYESGRTYYIDENGYVQLGLTEIDGNSYYLSPEGKIARGWLEIEDSWYFFQFDGTMAVNTVVDGLYLGSDGKALSDGDEIVPQRNELREEVDSILSSIITPEMTEEEKIAACYWYVANNFTYKRTYETPQGDWTGDCALEILTTGMGNCYRFASAFAYLLTELGYETKVITGRIGTRQGGTTPHGWTEVKIENEWYVFDTELQYANRDKDYYWKTYETYPTRTLVKLEEWPVSF